MNTPSASKTLSSPLFSVSSFKSLISHSNSISKVRVVVRVRPFLPKETFDQTPISCVSLLTPEDPSSDEVRVHLKDQESSRSECYKLDGFFSKADSVTEIFESEVCPLIPGMFHGNNATVFAYGATGSGKTYTMQGSNELLGLMPLAMAAIFSMCEGSESSTEISYYEVYMDKCYDLLDCKEKEVSVFDDKVGKVHLKGLSTVPVRSMEEFQEVHSRGIQRRKVAHTGLNDFSSRSHGVLVIMVSTLASNGSGCVVRGKLNLIDLAGNEDNRRTCNEGIRLQESAKINQSLFALSNVIYALNNNKARVPYRESKLTRILQDSLGGTSRSVMIACLNPREYQESVRTVSLASRSRNISNCISSERKEDSLMETDMKEKLLAWLESNGKTKSVPKAGGLTSPLSKTPIAMSSLKNQKSCKTSTGAKGSIFHELSQTRKRNLFNSGAGGRATAAFPLKNIRPDIIKDFEERADDLQYDMPKISEEECSNDQNVAYSLQTCEGDHLNPNSSFKQRVYPLLDCEEGPLNSEEGKITNDEHSKENAITISGTSMPESLTSLCLANSQSVNYASSPTRGKIRALQQSLRNVLSPINTNINTKHLDDLPSKDQVCLVFFEPKTPNTPYVWSSQTDGLRVTDTPLSKFKARSSCLKSSLAQEYLEFLNTASREELLMFKGIGPKRADCILQLRETAPLASLYDLEKVGISSNQVHDMFRKTAREIFE